MLGFEGAIDWSAPFTLVVDSKNLCGRMEVSGRFSDHVQGEVRLKNQTQLAFSTDATFSPSDLSK